MCAPRWRSAARPNSAAVNSGKASSTRIDVTRMFQVKIGIRNIVMPGARMQTADGQAHDPEVTARAWRVDRVGQRAIGGPAEVGSPARGDEARDRDRRAEQEQPERE